MKIKAIRFVSTTQDPTRFLSCFGGSLKEIYLGQTINHRHTGENIAVSSIDVSGSGRIAYVRFVYKDGPNAGKPCRVQTTNDVVQDWERVDFIGLVLNDQCTIYADDDAKQASSKQEEQKPEAQQKGK
jgi:hypothetical protein